MFKGEARAPGVQIFSGRFAYSFVQRWLPLKEGLMEQVEGVRSLPSAPWKRARSRTRHAGTLPLASRTVRDKFLLLVCHPVCGVSL